MLPAGDTPPNPSELLGSQRMSELLAYLGQQRIVVIDAPPVLPVADAAVLAKAVDGIVLVLQAGRSTDEQLEQSLLQLDQAGGSMAGLVLNKAASSKLARMRYGDSEYGYGYKDSEYGYRRRKGEQTAVAAPVVPRAPTRAPASTVAPAPTTPTPHAKRDSGDMQEFFEEIGVTTSDGSRHATTGTPTPHAGEQTPVRFPPLRSRNR